MANRRQHRCDRVGVRLCSWRGPTTNRGDVSHGVAAAGRHPLRRCGRERAVLGRPLRARRLAIGQPEGGQKRLFAAGRLFAERLAVCPDADRIGLVAQLDHSRLVRRDGGVTTTRSIAEPLSVNCCSTAGVGAIICMSASVPLWSNASILPGFEKCTARTITVELVEQELGAPQRPSRRSRGRRGRRCAGRRRTPRSSRARPCRRTRGHDVGAARPRVWLAPGTPVGRP